MRIGLISDLHLGYYPDMLSRVLDWGYEKEIVSQVIERLHDEKVDMIGILGDLLHTWRGRNGWMSLMHLIRLIREYKIPVFMVRGNHDVLYPDLYREIEELSDGYFITFVGENFPETLSPIWADEEIHKGIAYERVMDLHSIVKVVLLPHVASVLPKSKISQLKSNTDAKLDGVDRFLLFAHYFVDSRVGGLGKYITEREYIIPDKYISSLGGTVFAGHDHRHYEGDEVYVIGSMLPRDSRLGGEDVSFAIADIDDRGDVLYRHLTIPLPYKLIYSISFHTGEEAVSFIEGVLENKELIAITNMQIEEDITYRQIGSMLANRGIDMARVVIRRVLGGVSHKKADDGRIVQIGPATISIDQAFNEYIEGEGRDIEIPKDKNIKRADVISTMQDILSELMGRGDGDHD